MIATHARRIAAGLCKRCGLVPPRPNRRECADCHQRTTDRVMANYDARVELGLCVHFGCKRNARADGLKCEEHAAEARKRAAAYYAKRKAVAL